MQPLARTVLLLLALFVVPGLRGDDSWVVYQGGEGAGKGKHVVLVSGDEEYRSEEMLPQLGKILAQRHGFTCTVLFAIDPASGMIDPGKSNIPGLENLASADLMILFTRFRNLPDEQMKHFLAYVDSGKPIIGLRTATHAFNIPKGSPYAKYSYNSSDPTYLRGFGRQVLGETWVGHHGQHGKEGTRGILNKEQANHPILKGLKDGDIWGPSDVYGVKLPADCVPLVFGQVTADIKNPDAPAVEGKKNDPMMPIAWTKPHKTEGKVGRTFTCTTANGQDFLSAGLRRLLVNATYWAVGMEDTINPSANVDLVGRYEPLPFAGGKHRKGVRPADLK